MQTPPFLPRNNQYDFKACLHFHFIAPSPRDDYPVEQGNKKSSWIYDMHLAVSLSQEPKRRCGVKSADV